MHRRESGKGAEQSADPAAAGEKGPSGRLGPGFVTYGPAVAIIAASVLLLTGCLSQQESRQLDARSQFESGEVTVVAHRGCWGQTPENSLASIETCIDLGVDMVELDVRRTRDGELVLMHDETLDRTTSASGRLADRLLAELATVRLRDADGGPFARLSDENVPTLEQALRAASDRILVNVDMKDPGLEIYDSTMALVDRLGVADQVVFKMRASPDDAGLTRATFHGRAPFMPILVQCNEETRDGNYCSTELASDAARYDRFSPVAYEVVFGDDSFVDGDLAHIIERGGAVWVNTLDPSMSGGRPDDKGALVPDDTWGTLIDMGVSIIQTDEPTALLAYLQRRGS